MTTTYNTTRQTIVETIRAPVRAPKRSKPFGETYNETKPKSDVPMRHEDNPIYQVVIESSSPEFRVYEHEQNGLVLVVARVKPMQAEVLKLVYNSFPCV